MRPVYFSSPAEFRDWLRQHHATETELLVGYHKKASGNPTMTWSESVDEALCYGWIDGVRRSVDDARYTIRFTPRKPRSNWSNVNIAKVQALIAVGRMQPAGLAAWAHRSEERSGVYTFERTVTELDAASLRRFKADRAAWRFFEAQPPGYRKLCIGYITSAKRAETRERRLAALIEASAKGLRVR